MKRWLPLGLMLALLCGVCGCKAKHEAIVDEVAAIVDEMADILDSVKDQATADAAVKTLENLRPRLKEAVARLKALPEPSKEEQERLKKKIEAQQEKNRKRGETNSTNLKAYPKVGIALVYAYMEFKDVPPWYRELAFGNSGESKDASSALPGRKK